MTYRRFTRVKYLYDRLLVRWILRYIRLVNIWRPLKGLNGLRWDAEIVPSWTRRPSCELPHRLAVQQCTQTKNAGYQSRLVPVRHHRAVQTCADDHPLQGNDILVESRFNPPVANLFMENVENNALQTDEMKPSIWLRYVDDTYAIWWHGKEVLHRSSQAPNIHFNADIEKDNQHFLDVLVSREPKNRTMYTKPTHTDRYRHGSSNHHPVHKRPVLKSLT